MHSEVPPTKLAIVIGKPSIITASSTPMSTPSSRALVATMPRRLPSKASCSIRRRSYSPQALSIGANVIRITNLSRITCQGQVNVVDLLKVTNKGSDLPGKAWSYLRCHTVPRYSIQPELSSLPEHGSGIVKR